MEKHILIIDDHPFLRMGVKAYIAKHFSNIVCTEIDNANETLEILEKIKFDFSFIDISLGNEDGLELAGIVKNKQPGCRVIILSMHKEPLLVQKARDLNLDGYLVKEDAFSSFSKILESGNSTDFFLSERLEKTLSFLSEPVQGNSLFTLYNQLTQREQTIFRLLAEGMNYKEAAYELGIKNKTVLTHRYNLMNKMNLKNQTDIIKCAVRLGLISF